MPSQHSFRSTWSPAPLGRRLGLDPPRASRKGSHRFWVSSGLELVRVHTAKAPFQQIVVDIICAWPPYSRPKGSKRETPPPPPPAFTSETFEAKAWPAARGQISLPGATLRLPRRQQLASAPLQAIGHALPHGVEEVRQQILLGNSYSSYGKAGAAFNGFPQGGPCRSAGKSPPNPGLQAKGALSD